MKKLKSISFTCCLLLNLANQGLVFAASGPVRSKEVYEVQKQAVSKFVRASEHLASDFQKFCKAEQSLDQLKQSWQSTVHSWMYLQGQERGPDAALEKSWNIQFWPDKKNTTGRKMALLVKQTGQVSWQDISAQSVTVQGIGAIEWLLYDRASPISSNRDRTCELGVAITQNLNQNASAVGRAWGSNPWSALSQQQWYAEYLALLSNQLDYTMKKLSRPMAKPGKPKPYFSESWRSQISLANIRYNIDALESVYLANGDGLDLILREKGHPDVADRIKDQLETMKATWPDEKGLFNLLQTRQGYREVFAQYNKLEYLNYLIHEEAAIALGVVVGFNATDGD